MPETASLTAAYEIDTSLLSMSHFGSVIAIFCGVHSHTDCVSVSHSLGTMP